MNKLDKKCEAIESALAHLIEQKRLEAGLSKYELAHRAGLDETSIRRVERQERRPAFNTLLKVAHGLEVNLSELIQQAEKAAS